MASGLVSRPQLNYENKYPRNGGRNGFWPMNLHHLLGSVERVESLDAPAAATSRIAGRLIERSRLAGALRGSWLGHPVHPLLITIPVGT